MKDYKHYIVFADLFRYPEENYKELAASCQDLINTHYPEMTSELQKFTDYINTHNTVECQTLYTKTFDVQPMCYLDLGYVIFGEDYKRGAFLLHMQEEQRKANNDCGTDLSDNISNILTLYNKSKNSQLLDELAVRIMIPGLEKMIQEFEKARVDLKIQVLKKLHKAIIQEDLNHDNVYKNLFETMLFVFKKDFEGIHFEKKLDPAIDIQHHNSFFSKESVDKLTPSI